MSHYVVRKNCQNLVVKISLFMMKHQQFFFS